MADAQANEMMRASAVVDLLELTQMVRSNDATLAHIRLSTQVVK
jgi:hypothetical protein